MSLTASFVIATRNRPGPLLITLRTVAAQTHVPLEVIVVDSSEGRETRFVVEQFGRGVEYAVQYLRSAVPSAARQRNQGADASAGDVVVFIDDDVELEPSFLRELLGPFEEDPGGTVGGVSGTMVNSAYVRPRGLNLFLLRLVLGDRSGNWAGRVVGPAVNFLPADTPDTVQRVEWVNSGGTAFRRSVLARHRFGQQFLGYSFAEDLHLSVRIAREYTLLNNTRARYFHHDLGQHTHADWSKVGESAIVNRYGIMTEVLNRRSVGDRIRFFAFEILYGGLVAVTSSGFNTRRLRQMSAMMAGKLRGSWVLLTRGVKRQHA